jgi:hypothetical protein
MPSLPASSRELPALWILLPGFRVPSAHDVQRPVAVDARLVAVPAAVAVYDEVAGGGYLREERCFMAWETVPETGGNRVHVPQPSADALRYPDPVARRPPWRGEPCYVRPEIVTGHGVVPGKASTGQHDAVARCEPGDPAGGVSGLDGVDAVAGSGCPA